MKQFTAMRMSINILRECQLTGGPVLPESLRLPHLLNMLERVDQKFAPAKMGRWLGWTQAAVVANGAANLERMKEMNAELDGPDDVELLIKLADQVVKGLAEADTNHGGLINTDLLTTANSLRLHLSMFK